MPQKTQFPAGKHHGAKMSILEGLKRSQIIPHHQLQLMDTATFLNRIEEDLIKLYHLLRSKRNLCFEGQFSQGVHNLGDIDLFRTANRTGLTGGADPDGGGPEYRFSIIDLDQAEHLVRLEIHLRRDGAPGSAFPTLDTPGDILSIGGQNIISELMNVLAIQITQGASPFSRPQTPRPPEHRSDHP